MTEEHRPWGGYPEVSPAAARDKNRADKEKIEQDIDPLQECQACRRALINPQITTISFAEAAYRRGDPFMKRRRLMDAWARFCSTIP